MSELPAHALSFIADLVTLQIPPSSIWLIGSRANGRAKPNSDTDLLVFGSNATIRLIVESMLPPQEIDCLVVFDGNQYRDPWQEKSGSLTSIKWQQLSDRRARYIGAKWIPDEEEDGEPEEFIGSDDSELGELKELEEEAIRLWPI